MDQPQVSIDIRKLETGLRVDLWRLVFNNLGGIGVTTRVDAGLVGSVVYSELNDEMLKLPDE